MSRYEWAPEQFRKLLSISPNKIVADIGAGDGRMCGPVVQAGGDWFGFDLVPASGNIQAWNIEKPASAGAPRASVVLMLDVLEHLRNPWMALQNVSDLLMPGGHLILTTPNPRWSRSRMWALSYGNAICFQQSDLDLNHHVFTPWPHIVERLLLDCGLTVTVFETLDGKTPWPKGPVNLHYPARFGLACVCKWIESRDATACGMSYGLIARKAK